jgi:hypothetical protein
VLGASHEPNRHQTSTCGIGKMHCSTSLIELEDCFLTVTMSDVELTPANKGFAPFPMTLKPERQGSKDTTEGRKSKFASPSPRLV